MITTNKQYLNSSNQNLKKIPHKFHLHLLSKFSQIIRKTKQIISTEHTKISMKIVILTHL